MAGGISNLGNFLFQKKTLASLRTSLLDAQRQIATGKRTDIYAGLGVRTQEVQRLRADINTMESYSKGIDAATIRGNLMDVALTQTSKIATELRKSLSLMTAEGNEPDMVSMKAIADKNFDFIQNLLNTESNGRYLFSGSNISTRPFENDSALTASVQSELDAWFDGTQTVDDFLNNIKGLSGTNLGYSLDLNSATSVKVRVDDGRDVDYTVLANEGGFPDLLRVATVMKQIEFPDPNDPTVFATKEEYYRVMNELNTMLGSAVKGLTDSQSKLAVARTNMASSKTSHTQDITALKNIVDSIENVDPAEAIVKLQAIENQLNASYNTISTLRDLSLVNFL